MKKLLSIILSLLILFSATTFAEKTTVKGTIKVGVDANFAPFEYYEDGKLSGFDIELMNYIGEQIGYNIEYVDITFDALIPAILSGRVDCAISAMTVTEEREEVVDFTTPYLVVHEYSELEPTQVHTEKYGIVFKSGLSEAVYSGSVKSEDEELFRLFEVTIGQMIHDDTIYNLIEEYNLDDAFDKEGIDYDYTTASTYVTDNDKAVYTDKTFTFDELTKISSKEIQEISIACSKGERTEFTTDSPLIITGIINAFKDIQFIDDTREGGAGGWLYGINFYVNDGTYVQFGGRIHIDEADYKAVDHNIATEKMAYYYELMKKINDSSEWARESVYAANEIGITDSEKQYIYKNPITREEFCELVYNLIEVSTDKGWSVPANLPFKDAGNSKIAALYSKGIIKGKSTTEFAPNDSLTREESATIIIRMINKIMPMPATELWFEYDDIGEISKWASDAVQTISNLGFMNGVGNNRFAPKDTYTTEQAIATLARVHEAQSVNAGIIGGADEPTAIYINDEK